MIYFLIGLILILAGGLLSLIIAENYKATLVALFSLFGNALILIPTIKTIMYGGIIEEIYYLPEPIGNIPIVLDPLSAFFVLIISVMSLLGTVYAAGYIKSYLNKKNTVSSHFLFLSLLISSMLAVVTVQNSIFFLIVWEIMSLSSFFLVVFENRKKETLSAGINYLIYMHISVIFIILGFVLLILQTGSLEFNSFKVALSSNSTCTEIVFLLLFVGFGIKAGFVPFHNWLPKAHPAAPSHVSGIMSGVMIKMGIYGILRFLFLMDEPSPYLAYFVLAISVISALYGVLYAIAQHDLKRLLAYHSIENIGIIGIGIAIGMLGLAYHNTLMATLGFAGGILHILNHSIFKELLFFAAGSVFKQTHTMNVEKLGGLIKSMPKTAALFLIGSLAITGLPPLNGFISEFLIYLGMLKAGQIRDINILIISVLAIAALALVGTMALLCFTKAFSIVFLGSPRSKEASLVESDVSTFMIFPMSILAIFTFLIGVFPQFSILIVSNTTNMLLKGSHNQINTAIPMELMQLISFSCLAFIVMIVIFILARKTLLEKRCISVQNTWGCGYNAVNNRMQYTASSYAKPFLSILNPFFIKHVDLRKPSELFPKEAHLNLHIQDIEEFYLVNPIIKADKTFLSKFQWLQGGDTQQYILYGLIFLLIALLGSVLIP